MNERSTPVERRIEQLACSYGTRDPKELVRLLDDPEVARAFHERLRERDMKDESSSADRVAASFGKRRVRFVDPALSSALVAAVSARRRG
jgi:hypothetical protein